MSNLQSNFEEKDLDLLYESIDEYEKAGQELLMIINQVKNIPPLPDNVPEEIVEYLKKTREYYASKEKEAILNQKVRQERTTLIKAKIILQKQDMAIEKLGSGN